MYGFTGVRAGYLPCLPIASTVTTVGRLMIEKTRDAVLTKYPGSRVIYGDTDSVMVIFAGVTPDAAGVQAAFALGEEAADWITNNTFPSPFITLEMEKVSWPYILFRKRRRMGDGYLAIQDVDAGPGERAPGQLRAAARTGEHADAAAEETTKRLIRSAERHAGRRGTILQAGHVQDAAQQLRRGAGAAAWSGACLRASGRGDSKIGRPRPVPGDSPATRGPRVWCTESRFAKANLEPNWLYYLDRQLLPRCANFAL